MTQEAVADYAWSVPGGLIERPGEYAGQPEIWAYCSQWSYDVGDRVSVQVHTTETEYSLTVTRDGLHPKDVLVVNGLAGKVQTTPEDAYLVGCGWETSYEIDLDESWEPGFYLVNVRTVVEGREYSQDAFFILKAREYSEYDFTLIHATSTMLAYNDWGGANHYRGLPDGHLNDIPSPVVSSQRPIARGMLRLPAGAPRNASRLAPGIEAPPRHPVYEFAWHHRYSRHYSDAGWATYERPMTVWAESNGYRVAHITQTDLQLHPEVLDRTQVAVIAGHDEYWSWEMRDTVDRFVDRGGKLARFGGNYVWQVRLDKEGTEQTCYKDPRYDPLYGVDNTRVTTAWDWREIGRPGAQTMGLSGLGGAYIRYGNAVPRASGGFTVYRPEHWAFEGTGLMYGDLFGGYPVCIAAFEVDGVDYTFRKGLPYATGEDGAPENLEILAMTPAVAGEVDRWRGKYPIGAPMEELEGLAVAMYGEDIPEYQRDTTRGSAMIGSFTRGKGEVFTAGSTEWVMGLIMREEFTEKVTHNVLKKFIGE